LFQADARRTFPLVRQQGKPVQKLKDSPMETALNIVIVLACVAVVAVLGMGLWNMLKGGSGNTSQKLMRARVILQALALILLMAALFFFGGNRGA
jgi:hypothetical protein